MARKKTAQARLTVKASLSRRLREIREEVFGEHAGPELARRLNLPARTWYNYESGVTVPAEVLLGFIEQTAANPSWLLSGQGPKYHRANDDHLLLSQLSPVELIRHGLEALERSPQSVTVVARDGMPNDIVSAYAAIGVYSLADLAGTMSGLSPTQRSVLAYRHWLPNPDETIAIELVDEAMYPILPAGSIVAIDRSVTDPRKLDGQIVAAHPGGTPMIRWLEVTGRHLILRPNNPLSKEFPLIPVEFDEQSDQPIMGQVVWSWSRFSQG